MHRFLLVFFLFCIAHAHAQSLANYNLPQSQPPTVDWNCGTHTFTSTAEVVLFVPPDGWVMELQGTEEDASLQTARMKIQQRTDAFTKALVALGIPIENITVTTANTQRNMGWKPADKGHPVYTALSYTVTKSVLIHYDDAKLYAQIISAGSEQSIDQLIQNYCTVGDEQEVYDELYRQALDVAQQKRDANAQFYNADVQPDWKISQEKYNVVTPTPGIYSQPGTQHQDFNGYDRVLHGEESNGGIRYTIHLQITYTLRKRTNTTPSNIIYH